MGDREGACNVASSILERFRNTTDSREANAVSWCWSLVADAAASPEEAIKLAHLAIKGFRSAPKPEPVMRNVPDPSELPSTTTQILRALDEPISMSFANETPLDDVLKYIKAATTTPTFSGIPIYVDPAGLQQAGVSMSSGVTLDLEGVPLKTSLRLLLKQLRLTYTPAEGVVMITSEKAPPQRTAVESAVKIRATFPGYEGPTSRSGLGEDDIASIPALGAALYRAGRVEDSLRRLEDTNNLPDKAVHPLNWPFLAMAHHRLGHRGEALRWLDRLRDPLIPASEQFFVGQDIRLLRSEAEALVIYDPVFPEQPFAN
jgi:hypothetical protein